PATVEHRADALRAAVEATRKAQITHELHDLIVVVERTGKYHQVPKRAWAAAGFDVRVVDPLATQRFRQPANPGDKTDDTDTAAAILEAGYPGLERVIREAGLRYQGRTLERILAWARTAAAGDEQPELRRRILLELDDDRRSKPAQVAASEGEMVKYLLLTEY